LNIIGLAITFFVSWLLLEGGGERNCAKCETIGGGGGGEREWVRGEGAGGGGYCWQMKGMKKRRDYGNRIL
jgi:hypothetical protein